MNGLNVLSVRISDSDVSADRWHLYKVDVSENQIEELSNQLKTEKWYAHFWDDQNILVVYPGKTFKISRRDKTTWKPAINFGLALGIPKEQLDFLIEE